MKHLALSPVGFAPDLTWDGTHLWVAYQPAPAPELHLFRIDPAGPSVIEDRTIRLAERSMAYPRVYWYSGRLWLAWLNADFAFLSADAGANPQPLSTTMGNWPMAFGHGWIAWQDRLSQQIYTRRLMGDPAWHHTGRYGAAGISRVLADGSVRTIEDDLKAEPGMYSPCWTEGMIAGESTVDNRGSVLRLPDGRECRLWQDHRVLMIRAVAIPGGWAVVGEPANVAIVTEADFAAPVSEPPHDDPEIPMNPPGVDILTTYPVTLSRTGTVTLVEWQDRNNAGFGGKVELVAGSVHVTLTNPAGRDRSGKARPVKW